MPMGKGTYGSQMGRPAQNGKNGQTKKTVKKTVKQVKK